MSSTSSPAQSLTIAYFGHDARETAVQRRIASLEMNGCRVIGFTFIRRHQAERSTIPFENVPLGSTVDRNYIRRLVPLAHGLVAALRHRSLLRKADILQARNIDMLLLALAAKVMSGAKGKVVYEVLDVQRIFVGHGRASRLIRAVERWLLRFVNLLVVSSPAFMECYFSPVQGYRGPWHLLENKISGPQLRTHPEAYTRPSSDAREAPPWVIGWFGVLRCRKSFKILTSIADRLGSKVRIYIRGRLSREDISETEFSSVISRHPNMIFDGPYLSPDDLARIYANVHFSWSVDYTDAGANSDWLLPNRLYEGGYFNAVALARQGTTTGCKVEDFGLGKTFSEPLEDSVCHFLESLDASTYEAMQASVADKPRALFVDEMDTREYVERLVSLVPRTHPAGISDANVQYR